MVAAAVIGTVAGAAIASDASRSASNKQADAARDASNKSLEAARETNDINKEIYDQGRADNEPWRLAGVDALKSLTGYKAQELPAVTSGKFGNANFSDAIVPDTKEWYRTALGREPTAAESSFWQSFIDKGGNPDDVYKTFLQSAKDNGETPNPAYSSWQQSAKSNYANARFSDPDSAYANTDIGSKLSEYRNPDFGNEGFGNTNIKDTDSAYTNPKLQNLLANFSKADFEEDPGYQYRLEQGNRGVENSAAAKGSQLSGATLKALARFNQNEASNEYSNVFDRFMKQKLAQYDQSVGDFGRAEGQRLDKYGQRKDEYNLNELQRQAKYGIATDQYNRADAQRRDQYGQRVDKFGRDEGQRREKYQQRVDEFGRLEDQRRDAYGQKTDQYNRNENQRINQYGISQDSYSRAVDEEGRNYNRLAEIAGIGQRVNDSNASAGRSYAQQVSANTNNAASEAGRYGLAAGAANASGTLGIANAITSGMNNLYGIYKNQGFGDSSNRNDEMARLRAQAAGGY